MRDALLVRNSLMNCTAVAFGITTYGTVFIRVGVSLFSRVTCKLRGGQTARDLEKKKMENKAAENDHACLFPI